MNYQERYENWLQQLGKDDPLRQELIQIREDENEKEDRFYQELTFGTAGLRGKMGAGTNRMNRYVVAKATQGIANHIKIQGAKAMQKGVVIAHDSRHFSKAFSTLAACILYANGIKAYVFPDLRPTPELAFMIRHLHATGGINITASHNPKEYNGYKVYWDDGCQVSSDVAEGMEQAIQQVGMFNDAKIGDFEEGIRTGMISVLDDRYDVLYLNKVLSLKIHDGEDLDLTLPIVYTPLNGAGSIPFAAMLQKRGFTNFHIVEEQRNPDPDFTTVGYPNPEDPKAFKLSEALGKKVHAQLLMATDPDADRFAIEILNHEGDYVPLNGNQTGYLLVQYILEGRKTAHALPSNGAMVKSIVTSPLSTIIAKNYGVQMFESLTGFKNICGRIPFLEENGYEYLFGYEESVGYAACKDIRDKDGISAGMLVAEAAAYYAKQGKTLYDVLQDIYAKYGAYNEEALNIILEGSAGTKRIARMMNALRTNPPKAFAGQAIRKVIDYQNGYEDIPTTNALRFHFDEDSFFAVRPSGTEPKIKFYFYMKQDTKAKADALNQRIKQEVYDFMMTID